MVSKLNSRSKSFEKTQERERERDGGGGGDSFMVDAAITQHKSHVLLRSGQIFNSTLLFCDNVSSTPKTGIGNASLMRALRNRTSVKLHGCLLCNKYVHYDETKFKH